VFEAGSRLFGTSTRTAVLVAIRLLEETYSSELAELLGVRPYTVQSILASLEREAVVVSRLMGRTRTVCLNPRYFAQVELSALLWKLGEQDLELQSRLAGRRRRPRRAGKPGLP
jgi:predicted transcriptional regulator